MNKQLAQELDSFAQDVARRFSKKSRAGNFNNETFEVDSIIPMTDATATVIFKKNTGKKAAFFFYHVGRGSSAGWKYFVPTDAHILGMHSFNHYKLEIERGNYSFNFESSKALT
jgi:hypothetical protein